MNLERGDLIEWHGGGDGKRGRVDRVEGDKVRVAVWKSRPAWRSRCLRWISSASITLHLDGEGQPKVSP